MKGISVIGALRVLENARPNLYAQIQGFAGTSIGALIALVLCCGGDASALEKIVMDKNMTDITGRVNVSLLLSDHGLIKTDATLGAWVAEIMQHYFGRTNITFQQLYRQTNRELTVVVSNLTQGRLEYWNHKTAPERSVLTAVCASACFPMLFTPVIIDDQVYVDGGLGDNFPYSQYPLSETIGFNYGKVVLPNNPSSIVEYMAKVVNFIANRSEMNLPPGANIVDINPGPILIIDFFMDAKKKRELIQAGDKCCKEWVLRRIPAIKLAQSALIQFIQANGMGISK